MITVHESKLLELYKEYDDQMEVKNLLIKDGNQGMKEYIGKLDEMFKE